MKVLVAVVIVLVALAGAADARGGLKKALTKSMYKIDGPWGIGNPVHEFITLSAVKEAGGSVLGCTVKSDLLKQALKPEKCSSIMRGVFFNDDPNGLLFDTNWLSFTSPDNWDLSSGALWTKQFFACEKKTETMKTTKDQRGFSGFNANRLCRSHFGDLMYLHAQDFEGNTASETQRKIIDWAEYAYKLATGKIACNQKLKDTGMAFVKENFMVKTATGKKNYFGGGADFIKAYGTIKDDVVENAQANDNFYGDQDSNFFFNIPVKDGKAAFPCNEYAAGALAHTIEDSYASGHAQRSKTAGLVGKGGKAPNNLRGDIIMFTSYSVQDGKKHAKFDVWDEKKFKDPEERLDNVEGARSAVAQVAELFKLIKGNKPWEAAKGFIQKVFKLDASNKPAGAGEGLGRDAKK